MCIYIYTETYIYTHAFVCVYIYMNYVYLPLGFPLPKGSEASWAALLSFIGREGPNIQIHELQKTRGPNAGPK